MENHYEPLPDEWLIRAYKEIYKNMSLDKEYIKKIDSLKPYVYNSYVEKRQSSSVIAMNQH